MKKIELIEVNDGLLKLKELGLISKVPNPKRVKPEKKADILKTDFIKTVIDANKDGKDMPDEVIELANSIAFENEHYSGGYVIVSKYALKKYGTQAGLLYCELLSKRDHWKGKGELNEDGWFWCTDEDMMNSTGLTERPLRRCREQLKEHGAIEYMRRGIPAKMHYRITFN